MMRVGVLAGGASSEREISLKSGRAVHNALIQEGIDAFFLDVRDNIYDIIKSERMDVAFLALHGAFGEDGTVQRILGAAGIPYTGSGEEASRLALDKIASKEIFIKRGIPTPRFIVLDKSNLISRAHLSMPYHEQESGSRGRPGLNLAYNGEFPIVVKPQLEGSSIGLTVVREERELESALAKAFEYGPKVLIEEYIAGRELTVSVLGEEALPVIEIVPKDHVYDYKAKYTDPDTQYLVPAPITEAEGLKARELAKRAHDALGCSALSRTDMMMDGRGRIFVLEVNTIPGMTERSLLPKAAQAAGLDFNKLCLRLVREAYEKAKKV